MILLSLMFNLAFAAQQPSLCTEVQGEKMNPLYEKIWEVDLNRDNRQDVLVKNSNCNEHCGAALYINCGKDQFEKGQFVEVLEESIKHASLVPTAKRSFRSPGFPVLRGKQQRYAVPAITLNNERLDDASDPISSAREQAMNEVDRFYRSLGVTSPEDFAGEYHFMGTRYQHFFTEDELNQLMALTAKGDPDSAHVLFHQVLRDKTGYPLYSKYKEIIQQKHNMAEIFETGLILVYEDVPSVYLKDSEIRRYYARSNASNLGPERLAQWINESPNLAREIVEYSGDNLLYLPENLRLDESLVEAALAKNKGAIQFVDSSFLAKKRTVIKWCKRFKISARYVAQPLLADKEVAEACMGARPTNYQFFSAKIRSLENIAAHVLASDGYMLAFAPSSVKSNLKIVERAIANYPAGKKYLSPEVLRALGKGSAK